MSFFNVKNKFTYILSISLKSSSIDFQLIQINTLGKKEVVFAQRETLFLEDSRDSELYTKQYSKELDNLFQKNNNQIKQIIKNQELHIKFILYTPWFTSTIMSVDHHEKVLIDENFLIKKIGEIETNKDLQNLEKRLLSVRTNGYVLPEVKHIKSKDVNLSAYISYISKQIFNLLEQTVKKNFQIKTQISYTTSPLFFSDLIKQFLIKEDNLIFLHIDNEITELGIIEDDSLVSFITFPIGVHDFLRNLQTTIKTYDYDLLYQKEILLKSSNQKDQFELLKKTWEASINESLKLFKKHIPNKILLITDSKTKDFFNELLSNSIKNSPENPLKNHRIINFDISLLKDIIAYKTPVGENELNLKLEALI